MSELLTQEVGSLAKPDWRVAVVAGREITDAHITEAQQWAEKLGTDTELTTATLEELQGLAADSSERVALVGTVRNLAAEQAVRLQERAGIDIVYDGEQDRSEMYQHSASRISGFEPRGRLRVFDNRQYRAFAATDELSVPEPWHTDEVERLQGLTDRAIKVPITGAYTLGDWSFDEHFGSRRDFVLGLARDVVRPNLQALFNQGVDWIQIDEPAAGTRPEENDLFVESFNESVKDLLGKFSVHICFSDYSKLFPAVQKLENCSQFSLEFANRDGSELGVDAASRPAYDILELIKRHNPDTSVGLGVTSIHDNYIERPELVRDRVLRAVDLLGDPAKVYPSPDCGLRTRSWQVAYDKLAVTAEGTQLAKEQL